MLLTNIFCMGIKTRCLDLFPRLDFRGEAQCDSLNQQSIYALSGQLLHVAFDVGQQGNLAFIPVKESGIF